MDVFWGQMTEDVLTILKDILLVLAPANMTHIFELLHLTVNGAFKTFMSKKFSETDLKLFRKRMWGMDAKVDVNLTIMKPLHAKWLSEFYNYINSSDGQEITRNVWKMLLRWRVQNYLHSVLFLTYVAT